MLTEQEQTQIADLARHGETPRAALTDALLLVQRRHGWVSDEQLADVAALLEMTPAEVDEIATAYNLIYRQPVGRHVILLCDSVSCWIMGATDVAAHLRERLGIAFGETTADQRFTLLPIACLGACDQAPAMMIDDDLHGRLTPAGVDEILARYA